MRHDIRVALAALVSLTAACATRAPAPPAPAPQLLPAPFVAALLAGRQGASRPTHEFTLGRLPAGFPQAFVPPGPVTIVGGMRAGRELVVLLSDSTRRLAATLESHLESAGYSKPRPVPASGFDGGRSPYPSFCGDSGLVSVEPLTAPDSDVVRLKFTRVPGGFMCEDRIRARVARTQLALPPLSPPPGVTVTNVDGSGPGVTSNATAIGSGLEPAPILAHYAAQLVAAGWSSSSPAHGQRVAAQYFEASDSTGARWDGSLTVSGRDSALRLTLQMTPRGRP